MMMLRHLLALLLLPLALAACQSGPPQTLGERMGAYQWRAVSEPDSLFVMPTGTEDLVVGSWKKSWDNAIEQRTALRSSSVIPGESYLSLRFLARPMDVSELFSLGQSLSPTNYTDRSVPRRLREEFPGLRVEIVREPRRNRYGPYYYATAQHGSDRCVLAWQVQDSSSGTLPPHLRRLEMEYRLCAGGDPSVDSLLMAFDQGLVRPDTGVLPLGGLSMMGVAPPVQERPSAAPAASYTGSASSPAPAGAFPLPAGARAPAAPVSSSGAPAPRPLVNGGQRPRSAEPAPASSGFPMPGGR